MIRDQAFFRREHRRTVFVFVLCIVGIAGVALALRAYSDGLRRPFVADDYQWLVNVRGLSFAELLRTAFDPSAQHHFYRPLVWLLIWAQMQLFGLEPSGYHYVSLTLHLLNAALVGGLIWRIGMRDVADRETRRQGDKETGRQGDSVASYSSSPLLLLSVSVAAASIVAVHPAIFEAVTWMSAQSELLAALFLLLMLHLWLREPTRSQEPGARSQELHITSSPLHLFTSSPLHLFTVTLLALALLTKESAVIGLPLLWLFDRRPTTDDRRPQFGAQVKRYILPVLVVCMYLMLQVVVERNNYLLQRGGYGLGWQLVLNPLRSLALIVAPLAGTEHADAAWLVPVGALVAVVLAGWMFDFRLPFRKATFQSPIANRKSKMLLALAVTLVPTAPFLSPPDSRYLYLPVLFAALLAGCAIERASASMRVRPSSFVLRFGVVCLLCIMLWSAATEVHAREGRWSAAGGPGGSLWRVAEHACAEKTTKRVVVVEPPLLAEHVQAIVALACGDDTQAVVVSRADVDGAVKRRTVVISFPEGSAVVERRR